MGLREVAFIALTSVFVIGGYMFSIMTMRVGEVAFVAPFRYTGILFALVLGFVFFAEWPTLLTLSGAAIVVGTGVYTILRERALAARR
jgi:S-adenosylmethionine uptake transporter